MKKKTSRPVLVAIFAHPDDEAFGPGGTLHIYTKTHDVYVICATRGEAGANHSDDKRHIGEIREQELRRSADILGITEVIFLQYQDGTLSNDKYHAIAKEIRTIIDPLRPEILLTFDTGGVSGHLDHIALSMITHYVFYQVDYAKELILFCLSIEERKGLEGYFVYVPPGKTAKEIDKTVDITDVWDTQVKAMMEHKSQRKDALEIIDSMKHLPMEEHFLVVKK